MSRAAWRKGASLAGAVRVNVLCLGVPLAMLTLSLLWRPNCGYWQGLGLFLLLVPPSVLFGVGVGWAVPLSRRTPRSDAHEPRHPERTMQRVQTVPLVKGTPRSEGAASPRGDGSSEGSGVLQSERAGQSAARTGGLEPQVSPVRLTPARSARWLDGAVALALLAVAVGGALWDLLGHPQLFTYSHVFGGVLGPIYDSELAVRPGLYAAKAQTLLWAGLLLAFGSWRRTRARRWAGWTTGLAVLVVVSLALAPRLGIVQTKAGIERVLSHRVDLGPVVLHLAPETHQPEAARLAEEALYRFESLSQALGVAPDEPVDVYMYPDPDTKAALIGSRETSVVPVWLPSPQVHMLADHVGQSLGHEMVHVLAREFGMPVARASLAIGLVEGLAVALEPPDGLPDATALVRAGLVLPPEQGGIRDPAEVVRATMSPRFWAAPAGVAYTANGAFSAWLLDRFGAAAFRQAYRTGQFEPAYGQSLASLARQWGAEVAAMPLDPEAVAVARWMFSRPSLFQVRCPHWVPPATRLARDGRDAWDRGDLDAAAASYRAAAQADPLSLPALDGRLALAMARRERVTPAMLSDARALADTLPEPGSLRHLADVRRLLGQPAGGAYRAARDSLAPVDAVGRLLLDRRRRLPAPALRALLAAHPDRPSAAVADAAPVLGALAFARADHPVRAWEVARRWCAPDPKTEAGRVTRWLQARLAIRAGALETADALLDGLDQEFERRGPRSYAALVRDDRRRVGWRRATGPDRPAILGAPPDVPDALAPACSPPRPGAGLGVRPARGGVRVGAGGGGAARPPG